MGVQASHPILSFWFAKLLRQCDELRQAHYHETLQAIQKVGGNHRFHDIHGNRQVFLMDVFTFGTTCQKKILKVVTMFFFSKFYFTLHDELMVQHKEGAIMFKSWYLMTFQKPGEVSDFVMQRSLIQITQPIACITLIARFMSEDCPATTRKVSPHPKKWKPNILPKAVHCIFKQTSWTHFSQTFGIFKFESSHFFSEKKKRGEPYFIQGNRTNSERYLPRSNSACPACSKRTSIYHFSFSSRGEARVISNLKGLRPALDQAGVYTLSKVTG